MWKTDKQYLAGLAVGLWMSAVQAAPLHSSAVALSHFKVELTDLAPADGIAPAIAFAPASDAFSQQILILDDRFRQPPYYFETKFYGAGTHAIANPGLRVGASASTQPFELAVQTYTAGNQATAAGRAFWQLGFTLTPHTQALLTIDFDATQTNDVSQAWGELRAADQHEYSFVSQASSFEAGTMQRSLSGIVVSAGDQRPRTLSLSAYSFVAAPIPEPDTYAMLLGGLAILGWQGRRRPAG